ncbi:MAG: PilT/PilU family type 4a pilus ATPase [Alphaproteobacteria bacterium]|nr:PilT/PilU family type 4a pilus ATPase [Alphaproteobacteria bacterium]MDP7222441.1 PilT/PilU family type 4a pilus ATPase [Alphaproteobacteria bacterium]
MTPPKILKYFEYMHEVSASDLYLTVGFPPSVRTDMGVQKISDTNLTVEDINEVLASVLTPRQRREYEATMELNTSLDAGAHGRYRVNILQQRQRPAMVIRRIISKIPSFQELALPGMLGELALKKRGLVLVTGMTGSGKSTTLASMINHRNAHESGHIITIEDPIEYFYEHQQSLVSQREIGVDTENYAVALKNALRQRPDVILVGEIRDREVMEHALMAAETGHLCLSTLHTNNASQSIERVVNMFPEDYHDQVRLNLATNLQAIISQRLVPSVSGGSVVALEIMLNQGLIKELIQKGDISKIRSVMEENTQLGMRTFDQSLLQLYSKGEITEETALSYADQAGDLKIKIHQKQFEDVDGDGDGFRRLDTSSLAIKD